MTDNNLYTLFISKHIFQIIQRNKMITGEHEHLITLHCFEIKFSGIFE